MDQSKPHRVTEDGKTTVFLGNLSFKVGPKSAPQPAKER